MLRTSSLSKIKGSSPKKEAEEAKQRKKKRRTCAALQGVIRVKAAHFLFREKQQKGA